MLTSFAAEEDGVSDEKSELQSENIFRSFFEVHHTSENVHADEYGMKPTVSCVRNHRDSKVELSITGAYQDFYQTRF